MALDGDEARSDRVHGDSQVGELSGPAARETDAPSSVTSAGKASATPLANGTDHCERLLPAVEVVDGHGQPIPGEAAGDRVAKPARTLGHKGDARSLKVCRQGGSSIIT